MTFAEDLTPQERDKVLAEIMAKITPKKKPPRSGLRKTNANMRKYCKPPEGCFECPFPDCVAGTGTRGFGKRTDKEIEYLNNAVNITDKNKEMMT